MRACVQRPRNLQSSGADLLCRFVYATFTLAARIFFCFVSFFFLHLLRRARRETIEERETLLRLARALREDSPRRTYIASVVYSSEEKKNEKGSRKRKTLKETRGAFNLLKRPLKLEERRLPLKNGCTRFSFFFHVCLTRFFFCAASSSFCSVGG